MEDRNVMIRVLIVVFRIHFLVKIVFFSHKVL